MTKRVQRQLLFGYLIFAIVGAGFIIGGIAAAVSAADFRKTAEQAAAVVTNIHTETYRNRDGKTKTSHTVYVEFFVNGERYVGTLDYYSEGMAAGKTVNIYYNPNNPGDFRSSGGGSLHSIFLFVFGLSFFLIGFVNLYKQLARSLLKKRLLAEGIKVAAAIVDIIESGFRAGGGSRRGFRSSRRSDGRPGHILICEYKDKKTGIPYSFESENVWESLSTWNEMRQIEPLIDVFVDRRDYSKYYVDVDGYLSKLRRRRIEPH